MYEKNRCCSLLDGEQMGICGGRRSANFREITSVSINPLNLPMNLMDGDSGNPAHGTLEPYTRSSRCGSTST
jgi:hypothetical protein